MSSGEANVINISSVDLSDDQQRLLSRGLSFVPSKKADSFTTKVELFKFFRSIRLKAFYMKDTIGNVGDTGDIQIHSMVSQKRFKPKSTFVPHVNNASIDTFCRLVEKEALDLCAQSDANNVYPNLLESEKKALIELMNNDNLVIRNADKGGAVVVQDKTAYVTEIQRQLSDSDVYKCLRSDPTLKFSEELKLILKKACREGQISVDECKYMTPANPRRPVMYTLPKIHKNLLHPPGRPIVSGNGSLTEPISQFVDFHIKDLVYALPSYLRDTMDFLNKLSVCKVVCDDVLCTMDVSSLYPSIPHEDGIDALRYYLLQRPLQVPSTDFLLCLTKEVLSKNYFKFQDEYYLQLRGSAMGSPMAPNYANLFMGKFELDFVSNNNPYFKFIKYYWRYIDDLFFIWSGSIDLLQEFHEHMNTKMRSIKFTLEYDKEKIAFLDVMVRKMGNVLDTELYKKDTDRNTFLQYSSYHPPALKQSLPYSQLSRVKRICASQDSFETHAKNLCDSFKDRGYKNLLLQQHLNRVRQIQRTDLLQPKHKYPVPQSLALVSTYSPISEPLKHIVRKHWHILETDPQIASCFTSPPRHFFKRSPNLRDVLVKTNLSTTRTHFLSHIPNGNFPCHNCVHCYAMIKGHMFKHTTLDKMIRVRGRITCNTKYVVYLLKCPCNLYYVGKTKRELKTRICEHKCSIRNYDEKSSVARHFNSAKHDVRELTFMGIEVVQMPRRGGDRDRLLLQREAYWIHYLGTIIPCGMNEEIVLSCFL